MRMRKKKHGAERIAACSRLLIPTPEKPKNPFIADATDAKTDAAATPPQKIIPSSFFPHENFPLALEIGCGKGRFSCDYAAKNPCQNLLAMERFDDVACLALEQAAARQDERPNDNLRFLLGDARFLKDWFAESCFDALLLNFSDPWPKKGYAKRRLTHRSFLELYRYILKDGGVLLFKTDNRPLFDFTLEELAAAHLTPEWVEYDLHSSERGRDNIMTEYEENFSAKGFPINACRVVFHKNDTSDLDQKDIQV